MKSRGIVWVLCGVLWLAPLAAQAEELPPDAVEAVVKVLQEQGLIDGDAARQILERKAEQDKRWGWLDRITLYGDLRGRYEGFFYDEDPLGGERPDRNRLRYRLRVGLNAEVNEYVDVKLRFASGGATNSRNQTLGSGNDFLPDTFDIDIAELQLHPFAKSGHDVTLHFGKIKNPFVTKEGKDIIVWDHDFTPEGGALTYSAQPVDMLDVDLNLGYFVADENSGSSGAKKDPQVGAVQVRANLKPADAIRVGTQISGYFWSDLDTAFIGRASAVPGGFTDGTTANITDIRAWVAYTGIENVPLKLWGNWVHNYSAERTAGAGPEDDAWSVGLEFGDKKKNVALGGGWFEVQANAVAQNFTDSDLFDGRTNREGWILYGARQLWQSTDLKFTLFGSDTLDKDVAANQANSDRIRLQTDLVVKF
ncbi:MAG: putative porin [Proteobacteria bacterium]|nr:putative porin [Pseudomonadota bacterium]